MEFWTSSEDGLYNSSLSLLGVATGGAAAASWFDSFDVGQGMFIRAFCHGETIK
jgi:hypothetical protein